MDRTYEQEVACPKCGMLAGQPCVAEGGGFHIGHAARAEARANKWAEDTREPGIGTKVYTYDRYGYARAQESTIVSETTQSWVTDRGVKLKKKGDGRTRSVSNGRYGSSTYYLTRHSFDEMLWVQANRHRIADFINLSSTSAHVLREVAKLIGYQPK